ncbi:Receptor-type tyrosine-protein phosphatase kappa [Halotydeus destructor]|nr:Receptor-type tyrosine-protein phosphatase kappa [Halotydeus destructor]
MAATSVLNSPRERRSKQKPAKKCHNWLLFVRLHRSVSTGLLNPLSKLQLSILGTGLIKINDSGEKASGIIPKKPFDLSKTKLATHIELLRKYRVLLKIEFHAACRSEGHTMRFAMKEENVAKNSKMRFIPYDYNRVVLDTLPGIPDSDYINASYVDSLNKPSAYIAAQGPIEDTVSDFWRMVWEQRSYIIVMLTKVFDMVRVMCAKYWPVEVGKTEYYAPMEVTLLAEEALAEMTIRTFRLRKRFTIKRNDRAARTLGLTTSKADEDGRIVYQLQYFNWHIHNCPFPNSLLQFRRRVRVYMEEMVPREPEPGPVVVHCSDGCGRTGTFLAIDANLEYADIDGAYDVFGFTRRMRQARRGMVESTDQYLFIYHTLQEAHQSGRTWFPLGQLSTQLKTKSQKNALTRQNEYQREYEKIVAMSTNYSIGDCAGGHRIENRLKNRNVSTVPPDNHRPYLSTFQTNDSTDYLNAVFVDGYNRAKEYIVTEWPMAHTVGDCWALIYDHNCNSVVVLGTPPDDAGHPTWWPTEKEKKRKFGPVFTVDCLSFNHYQNIKSWIFRINKKVVSLTELMSGVKGVPKMTQIFQIVCWPHGHKVPASTNALVELMNMVERWRQRSNYGPVCVISSNGRSRVGVYTAANVAIEQVVQHGEVDVFQAVKTVRRHRPHLVENMTEYKYCYDLVLHYVLHYLHHDDVHDANE